MRNQVVSRLSTESPYFAWAGTCFSGWADVTWTDALMYLSNRVYCVGDCDIMCPMLLFMNNSSSSDNVLLWLVSALRKDVGYLPMAKPDALNHLGIRRDCVHLPDGNRSLVVFIEGCDLSLSDWESQPETCENGIQGVPFAGRMSSSTALAGEWLLVSNGLHRKAKLKPCDERPLWNVL